MTDSCRPSSRRTSRSRSRVPTRAEFVLDQLSHARAVLHHDQRLAREVLDVTAVPPNGCPGGQARMTSSRKNGSKVDAAVAPRRADNADLERPIGDQVDDGLRVEDRQRDVQLGVRGLELAQELGEDDAAGAGRGAELERAREVALGLAGDVREDLLLERQEALGAAVQPQAGLRRLDAAARAVDELRPQPLLERPHLERDGRLRHAEALRRLREAAPLDDGAERSELARVHKETLYDEDRR